MGKIHAAISFNLDQHIVAAALPLFETEKVSAIEWSFDTLYKVPDIPGWFVELLQAFGNEHRLIGHGVYYSLFSGSWSPDQDKWLKHLEKMCASFRFDHISEHFGFMTGENFHQGAPLPIPYTPSTLALGRDRLNRIYQACQCPVGLENLAFAYSLEEVKRHGVFLEELVSPINGFLILDLHNVYCQAVNFQVSPEELLNWYPLERVREMHISGGSWEDSTIIPGKQIRRDTHDDSVPEEVFVLLEKAIRLCPNVKFVVLEQLANGLSSPAKQAGFREDFGRMESIVANAHDGNARLLNDFLPHGFNPPGTPVHDTQLSEQQLTLSRILEHAEGYEQARQQLESSSLSNTAWQIEHWDPSMLQAAVSIAQKWKNGFA